MDYNFNYGHRFKFYSANCYNENSEIRTPPQMKEIESLIKDLPDAESASRFLEQFGAKHPSQLKKLFKKQGLLSDALTLAAYSPLLATTILQNPFYISWLEKARKFSDVREKEDILESLARFALTNSQIEKNILLARFRRRELLRVYLKDIRNLCTIAEITEDISNLADAILEFSLQTAKQELDNLYGIPLEIDEKGRAKSAGFCIVSLGKLGSKELNYASDIDLLFLYSADGTTSGQGSRGAITNKEYFVKLSEFVVKLVGAQTGEGAAYRVDMRLRPHGRVGALAISFNEAVIYYQNSAQSWERQVLIRSRASAGEDEIFRKFFAAVEDHVFSLNETAENALQNVRLSKDKINFEKAEKDGFNVKLGKGGIREIEFIAQALQLAYGGSDEWLRVAHTLKSLQRLTDRKLLTETELTELVEAYKFLRRLEHRLQMENGLQTHRVPDDLEKRLTISKRMGIFFVADFNRELAFHTDKVNSIFNRVFSEAVKEISDKNEDLKLLYPSLEKSETVIYDAKLKTLEKIAAVSPHFAELLAANPILIEKLPGENDEFEDKNYFNKMLASTGKEKDFAGQLAALRKIWSKFLVEIVVFDVLGKLSHSKVKNAQTKLAEASIETALYITKSELEKQFDFAAENYSFAVLGLGKLGGGGMDYESDLDLVLIYDDEKPTPVSNLTHSEFYSRAVEIFVNTLSGFTRHGNLYRVDLRLRPDGKNGATSIGKTAFLNYLQNRAAIWEWLAYVKLRGVAGDLAVSAEIAAREIVHENASKSEVYELGNETRRVRDRLEEQKSGSRKAKEIDIKFGEGGLLDVYFAVRFLQLRDNIPDTSENRSTVFTVERLLEKKSLSHENFLNFSEGYKFLTELDHNLRLIIGRSTKLPLANRNALQTISERMNFNSVQELLENLTFHRLNIRHAFRSVLSIHE